MSRTCIYNYLAMPNINAVLLSIESLLLLIKTAECTEISYVKILRAKIKFLKEFELNLNNLQVTV